ncbi:MAG TPA: alpha/beta hydrolase [Candidatus Limnocylindrales bacterium]|nr:alpha/beta hydrolase [Candidatus Limnocylindrales bacterium]
MRSRSWRLAGAIVIASLAGACAGGAPSGPSGPSAAPSTAATPEARDWIHDIDIGGRTLSIACVGPTDTGRPTVIFENGLGGDRGVWADVLTALGKTDRGCSYDRAGIGQSQRAPTPRTTDDQVTDLHKLLAAAGLTPPYVLVGHSVGGWNVMVYGGRYADDVAGAVMVDVRPPAFSTKSFAALPPEKAGEPDSLRQAREEADFEKDPSRNPEGLDLIKSAAQASASAGFGDRPLTVLVAGDRSAVTEGLPPAVAKDLDSIWMGLQTGLTGLSSNGRQEIVPGATHDMPFEKPDVIVKAIQDVLGEAGG